MPKRIIKIAVLFIFICTCLPSLAANNFVLRVFDHEEGLNNGTINDIGFDAHGFVWLATDGGVFRLSNSKIRRIDGEHHQLKLSSESINIVESLSAKHLLISGDADTYLYDIRQNTFARFGSPSLFPNYKGGGITALVKQDDHHILLTSEGELLHYFYEKNILEGIRFLKFDADTPWKHLVALDEGRFLIASEFALQLMDKRGLTLASFPWDEGRGEVNYLFKDAGGRVWLSTSVGLYEVDIASLELDAVEALALFVTRMVEDDDGFFWISSSRGLLKWRPGDVEYSFYKEQLEQDAGIDVINVIEIDDSGLIWVGGDGDGEGLAIVTTRADFLLDTFTASLPYSISNEIIWGIYADEHSIWLGTDGGLILIDKLSRTSATVRLPGLEFDDSIFSVDNLDANHLLLSTNDGLYVVNKKRLTSQKFAKWSHGEGSLEHKTVFDSYQDPSIVDRWWFMTSTGLYFWEPGLSVPQHMPVLTKNSQTKRVSVRRVFRDSSGNLWLGGVNLFGYLDPRGTFHSKLAALSVLDSELIINDIEAIDPDTFWLGTSSLGVIEYSLSSGDVRHLNKQWQTDCTSVSFIQDTANFRLVGCSNSILRYTKSSHEVLVLDHADGLLGHEINQGAFFYAPDEGLYVGTPDGAMLLDINNLSHRFIHHDVILEAMSVFYDDGVQLDLNPRDDKIIKPGARMIRFQLTGLDYLDDAPMTLRYRLRFETGTSEAEIEYILIDGQPEVIITGLQFGHYVLEVMSQIHGSWSTVPLRFTFSVEQNWWKAIWFKALFISVFFSIFIGVMIFRHRQVEVFKKINLALTETEERLRQSLRGSDSELWEWRHDTQTFDKENQGADRESDQLNYIFSWDELPIHREDKARVSEAWHDMLQGKTERLEIEFRFHRKDLIWGWSRVMGRPIEVDEETGTILRVAGIFSDITAQRQLEDDVKLLAQAFANTSEGVLILDVRENIIVSNVAAQSMIATTAEELNEKVFSELIFAKQGHSDEIVNLLQQKVTWTGERELLDESGAHCPVWLNVSAMLNSKGDVTHYVAVFSDITERKRTEADLRRLANYDILTGLPNRSLFATRLAQSIHHAEHSGEKLALIFLDLDRFKHVNDSYGHSMGDALLVEAANRLQSCISQEDTLCRFGGDEFVILLRDAANLDRINHICTRLLAQIKTPFVLYGREFHISTSIGVSLWPDDARQAEVLIKNADQAMYHAKEKGRGNFQYFSSERNAQALFHLRLESELRKAIERDEFELYYQPQVDVLDGNTLFGMEALLRWRHHEDGLIRTDIFIAVAESCGLIVDIDKWVLRQACKQGVIWSQSYDASFKLSVNISAVHFRQPDFVTGLKQILQETQFDPNRLGLEITEGVLLKEINIAKEHLIELAALGIDVAIDDFGTGYSSLAYLRDLNVNTLKIDRSFLINIATSEVDQAIASSIIELARNLKLNLVAEGVETKEQYEQVINRGCYVIQGYFFSKPLTAALMEKYMQDDHVILPEPQNVDG